MDSSSLGTATATFDLNITKFLDKADQAEAALGGLQSRTESMGSSGGFTSWVNQNSAALDRWGKGLLGFGTLILGSFAAPIAAGSRAAWGQVDAVEQATVAMRAYADSTEEVDAVLSGLLEYARSDMGVLFQRQDLFDAAQSMIMYGAAIEDVEGYVKTLSLSVGLGLSDWDSLNRVIGRVGSTGRLTGDDFDYLRAAGFQLDDSLRNTNITWQELFMHLEQGIPADALAGQADTIRGKTIRLQSALRGLGLAFLGVDSETSKFIEGGLGWQMMRGMERLTDLMKAAAPAVGQLGDMFAAIGRPIGAAFDLLLKLPQPIQTAMLMFTAATGAASAFAGGLLIMLPRIVSTIDAFSKMGMGVGLFLNPVGLAVAAVAALAAGFIYLYTQSEAFRNMINAMGRALDTLTRGAISAAIDKVKELLEVFQVVFGSPVTNTATLEVGALLDVPYSDWVEMPDGTWKNATLGLTATGSGLGVVSWVANPDSPDGKDWTLTVDTDGDGKDEALTIIASEDHKDGTYTLTAEYVDENGEVKTFTTWYDANSGKTIILDMDATGAVEEMGKTREEMTSLELKVDNVRTKLTGMMAFLDLWALRITRAFEAITNAITVAEGKISDLQAGFGRVGTVMLIASQKIVLWWDTAVDAVTGAWESIETAATAVASGIQTLVESVIGAIESAVESAINGLNKLIDIANKVPGINIGKIGDEEEGSQPGGVTRTERPRSQANTTQYDLDNSPAFAGLREARGIGQLMRDAALGTDALTEALAALNPTAQQSTIDMNKIASTAPVVGGSMQTADAQVKGAGAGIGSTFAGIAASAVTNFSAAQSTATSQMGALASGATAQAISARSNVVSQFAAMQSGTVASAIGMQAGVSAHMAALQAVVTSQASSARANAVSQFSSMSASAAGKFMGMQAQAGVQMAIMASNTGAKFGDMATEASTSGDQMSIGMTGWMLGAHAAMILRLSMMVSTVRNTGSTGYAAGYYAGSMISLGFANGMSAYLGSIYSAANAMVAAASAAVTAKAMISSPSRLFAQHGRHIGEGLEVGILRSIPDIQRASEQMIDASIPSPAFSMPTGHSGGTQYIDNSTHTTEYVALNNEQFSELLQAKERTNKMYKSTRDANALAGWGE